MVTPQGDAADGERVPGRQVPKGEHRGVCKEIDVDCFPTFRVCKDGEMTASHVGPHQVVRADKHSFGVRHLLTGKEMDVHPSRLKYYADSSLEVTEDLREHIGDHGMALTVSKLNDYRWSRDKKDYDVLVSWRDLESIEDSWKPTQQLRKDIPEALASVAEFRSDLLQTTDYVTLDYGYEVEGLPYFVISEVSSGPVDVGVKYSEQFSVLSTNFSGGPSQYATAVANSRRVETHRITLDEINATVTSMLSQPGQRWQTLRLLSGDSVTFEAVGLQASIKVIDDLSTLPGAFSSSNIKYNEIWNLGARAVSAACLDAGSQISSWSASEENGTFVPGTRPGVSYKSWNLSDYTLEFETRIIRGGVGFYIGYDITVPSCSTCRRKQVWYLAKLAVNSTAGNLVLWLDGNQVLDVTVAEFGYSDSQLTLNGYSTTGKGAIGFGGWQDQASFIRNVTATSLNDSTNVLYSNPMADESVVLPEFGVQSNTYGACLDGAKRDRYIWLGDFYHTTRIMGVANSKAKQITGMWEYLFNYQGPNGQYPGLMVMAYKTLMPTPEVFMFDAGTANAYLNFPDYDTLGLIGFVSYTEYFNDVDFARANWGSLKNATSWHISRQKSDGFIDVNKYVEEYVFTGSSDGTVVNAAAVQSLEGMAKVAEAVGCRAS
ncbi:hypothetical protein ON010_g1279 [Phytophthora cinnamomi]|nr:hypothetical protein ON010_g1279 [Phytophthora cinnamomi]